MPPPIAVTLGDPAGIGPEIVAQAWVAARTGGLPAAFFAIGPAAAFSAIGFTDWREIQDPAQAAGVFPFALPLLATAALAEVVPGKPDGAGASAAFEALEIGIGLARSGAARAIVTGPVSKAQLYGAGFRHPGQTEFVAERCGVSPENTAMLMVGGGLITSPATIHIPLATVPHVLTRGLIVARGRALARALTRDFGLAAPRIAVAGLNPHAGEGGALGRECIDSIAPAVADLCAEGIDARGPFPADTLFHASARTHHDAVLCMYHDQALIPVKTLAFESGVNMTAGLPVVRTSPDHGTAFSIAGCGTANPAAMIAAIALADAAAARRALALAA